MAIIKGNAVVNATSYELYEVTGVGYTVKIDSTQGSELLDKGDRWDVYIDGVLKGNAAVLDGQSFTGASAVTFKLTEDYGSIKYMMGGETFILDHYDEKDEAERTVTLTADLTIIDAWS